MNSRLLFLVARKKLRSLHNAKEQSTLCPPSPRIVLRVMKLPPPTTKSTNRQNMGNFMAMKRDPTVSLEMVKAALVRPDDQRIS